MSRNQRFISIGMAALFFLMMGLSAESAGGAIVEKDIAGITKRIYPSVVRVEAPERDAAGRYGGRHR